MIVLSAFFNSTALIGGICFLLNFVPFILGAVLSDKWMGLFPLWTGSFLSDYVQGVPMSEFDRYDYEPIFFSIIYIPICLPSPDGECSGNRCSRQRTSGARLPGAERPGLRPDEALPGLTNDPHAALRATFSLERQRERV